jgi:hypothetical protein
MSIWTMGINQSTHGSDGVAGSVVFYAQDLSD